MLKILFLIDNVVESMNIGRTSQVVLRKNATYKWNFSLKFRNKDEQQRNIGNP